jgi:RHS repeat-associated protein
MAFTVSEVGSSGQTQYQQGIAYMGTANIYVSDPEPPTVTVVTPSIDLTKWYDNVSGTVNVTATDAGLGVRSVNLVRDPGDWQTGVTFGDGLGGTCSGFHTSDCLSSMPGNASFNTATDMQPGREGAIPFVVRATDAVGGQGHVGDSPVMAIKLDHTPPNPISDTNPIDNRLITSDTYDTTLVATDPYSGAKKIFWLIDSAQEDFRSGACDAGGCTKTLTVSTDLTSKTDGDHTAQRIAKDALSTGGVNNIDAHTRVEGPVPWVLDRNPPTLSVTHTNRPTGWVDSVTPTARLTATDAGGGVKKMYLDSPTNLGWVGPKSPNPDSSCTGTPSALCPRNPAPVDLNYLTTGSGGINREGIVTVRAHALDAANRDTNQSWDLKVDSSAPTLNVSGPLKDREGLSVTDASYDLHVDATDGTTGSAPRSGVKSIEVLVDDASGNFVRKKYDTQSCATDSCPMSKDYSIPTDYPDGVRTIKVIATDQLDHPTTKTWQVLVDRDPPSLVVPLTHHNLPAGWVDSASPSVDASATDAGSGIKSFSLTLPTSAAPGSQTTTSSFPCSATVAGRCGTTATKSFSYDTSAMAEGINTASIKATDAVGHDSSPSTWPLKVDRTPPVQTVTGTLPLAPGGILVADSYTVDVVSTDGSTSSDPQRRAGVKSIEISVDGNREYYDSQGCDTDSCPMSRSWTFYPGRYSAGHHNVSVVSRDQLDHPSAAATYAVTGVAAPAAQSDNIGLEDWLTYDTTATGADSKAYVNVGTGNLVWQHTPIVNRGRGLSTFATLTYNSQEHLLDAAPLDITLLGYDQVGHGFSLGISGITRVNEPLDLKLAPVGIVKLTDPDGTRHVFRAPTGSTQETAVYAPPPGVHLRLRRYSTLPTSDKAWAATRPDGVTYYFNAAGYATWIEDRNGNAIRFDYQPVTPLTCSPAVPLVCKERLIQVVDPAGRSLALTYYDDDLLGLPGNGRIKDITDHASRRTHFEYRPDGRLTTLTESADSGARTFTFDYEPGGDPDLNAVTDPRNNKTTFAYQVNGLGTAIAIGGLTDKEVTLVRDRGSEANNPRETAYSYAPASDSNDARVTKTTITDANSHPTNDAFDDHARLLESVDARGTKDTYAWNSSNDMTHMVQAVGGPDEATTDVTYNPNGLMTSLTDGNGHKTELTYRDGSGTQRSALGFDGDGSNSSDGVADHQFVSDLLSVTTPKGTATSSVPNDYMTKFGLDSKGNVTSRTDAEGNQATTEYGADGVITKETDEVGNVTTYSEFDDNGLPKQSVDPRGNETTGDSGDGIWRRSYDVLGNVLSITDPRGGSPGTGDCAPFTTRLSYDKFDRLTGEIIPKDSVNGQCVHRSHAYDANGNETATVDARGDQTDQTFTAMDKVKSSDSAPVAHASESGTAREHTDYGYDKVDNLVQVVSPKGSATDSAGDFTTTYEYDVVNERVVQRRQSRGASNHDLVTSWAYDRRGNVVGMSDPLHNASGDAAGNAADSAHQRFAYRYDKADNQTLAIEDPSGFNYQTATTYDENDNKATQTDPRNHTTTWGYDKRDLLTDMTDPQQARTHYELRADGKASSITKPKGTATTSIPDDYKTVLAYNANGDVTQRTLPRAQGQYGAPDWAVAYTRDPVGNPTRITDARGHLFDNTFWDGGQLKSTDRPSWWSVNPADDQQRGGNPEIVEAAAGTGSSAPDAGTTPAEPDTPDVPAAGDFGKVDPQPLPDLLPAAGHTQFSYDEDMRLAAITDTTNATTSFQRDALGRIAEVKRPFDTTASPATFITTKSAFDRNGNAASATDGEGKTSTTIYDQFNRPVEVDAPGSTTNFEKTFTTYDDNGNTSSVQTPRGPDFTSLYAYDSIDRLTASTDPLTHTTTYQYDAADNKIGVRSPLGNGQQDAAPQCDTGQTAASYTTCSRYDAADQLDKVTDAKANVTQFGYDLNGNQTSIVAPGSTSSASDNSVNARTTSTVYDGRDLPWKTTNGDPGSQSRRTTVTEFDANGNLRRTVKPSGVDANGDPTTPDQQEGATVGSAATRHATVREYSPDDILTSIHLPWGTNDTEDQRQYREDFSLDNRGRVSCVDDIHEEAGTAATTRTRYERYDTGWIKSVSDPQDANRGSACMAQTANINYRYDKRGLQTEWRTQRTMFGRLIKRDFYENGLLSQRTGCRLTSSGDCETGRTKTYTYSYNPNHSLESLTSVDATDPNENRTTKFGYDGAEHQITVYQDGAGKRDEMTQAYDADGNVVQRKTDGDYVAAHDGQPAAYNGGKVTDFQYDELDRELHTIVHDGSNTRDTITTYHPSGDVKDQTRPNGVVDSTFYDDQGLLVQRKRHTPNVDDPDLQNYTYDADGNRTTDERGGYDFDSRGHLTHWTRANASDGHVDYEIDGSGQVTAKTDIRANTQEHTTYTHVNGRLVTTTGSVAGTTQYGYNDFGDITSVSNGLTADTTYYGYDEFERLVSTEQTAPKDDLTFRYDGLDRRSSECVGTSDIADACSGQGKHRHSYNYAGATEALTSETTSNQAQPDDDPTVEKTKTFDYTSRLARLGIDIKPAGQDDKFLSYAKNADGSVAHLETSTGALPSGDHNYAYDPFGDIANDSDVSADAKDNQFRFQGFSYDPEQKSYDMQARTYMPDVGRFTTADQFESSGSDFGLKTDPLTNSRYAFAAGNPIDNIESDGHEPASSFTDCYKGSIYCSHPRNAKERKRGADVKTAKRDSVIPTRSQPERALPGTKAKTPSLLKPLKWVNKVTGLHAKLHPGCINPATQCQIGETFDNDPLKAADRLSYLAGGAGVVRGVGRVAIRAGLRAAARRGAAKAGEEARTGFIGFEEGPAAVVPRGAEGPLPTSGPGFQFRGGAGGRGLDERITGVRIMDETAQHGRRVVYMNKEDQSVNPLTGQAVSKKSPWAHLPW